MIDNQFYTNTAFAKTFRGTRLRCVCNAFKAWFCLLLAKEYG
jgi:hypothetical protein